MMVDLGGGARERFQNVSAEEPEEALPPISSVGYAHPGSRSASWRSTFQVRCLSCLRYRNMLYLWNNMIDFLKIIHIIDQLAYGIFSFIAMPFTELQEAGIKE